MEINITKFFKEENADTYYGSVATHGPNAGKETYSQACAAAKVFNLLDTTEKQAAFKRHIKGFGAWTDEEIEIGERGDRAVTESLLAMVESLGYDASPTSTLIS